MSDGLRKEHLKTIGSAKQGMTDIRASLKQGCETLDGQFDAWFMAADAMETALQSGGQDLAEVSNGVSQRYMADQYRIFKDLVDGFNRSVGANVDKVRRKAGKL